jgi:proline iminopeptidase
MSNIREDQTDQYTITSGHLAVGNGHKVYYEQWGNPKATTPVVSFHGGPGGHYKRAFKTAAFDPSVHQVIFFDQRGSGNSLPYGKTEHNTTDDIITDTEKILDHLGIKHVYTYGRSWGATLATLFTIRHPDRVKATIVGGVYLGSREEIDHVDRGHFERFYPEVWEKLVASVPANFRDNPTAYHYQQLRGKDPEALVTSAKALEDMEVPLILFDWHGYGEPDPEAADTYDYVPYLIYAHYLSQNCFVPDNYLLEQAKHIKTPFAIVQGRYDMCCPAQTAYRLHKTIPHSKLYMTLGSHSGGDPANRTVTKALIDTMFI